MTITADNYQEYLIKHFLFDERFEIQSQASLLYHTFEDVKVKLGSTPSPLYDFKTYCLVLLRSYMRDQAITIETFCKAINVIQATTTTAELVTVLKDELCGDALPNKVSLGAICDELSNHQARCQKDQSVSRLFKQANARAKKALEKLQGMIDTFRETSAITSDPLLPKTLIDLINRFNNGKTNGVQKSDKKVIASAVDPDKSKLALLQTAKKTFETAMLNLAKSRIIELYKELTQSKGYQIPTINFNTADSTEIEANKKAIDIVLQTKTREKEKLHQQQDELKSEHKRLQVTIESAYVNIPHIKKENQQRRSTQLGENEQKRDQINIELTRLAEKIQTLSFEISTLQLATKRLTAVLTYDQAKAFFKSNSIKCDLTKITTEIARLEALQNAKPVQNHADTARMTTPNERLISTQLTEFKHHLELDLACLGQLDKNTQAFRIEKLSVTTEEAEQPEIERASLLKAQALEAARQAAQKQKIIAQRQAAEKQRQLEAERLEAQRAAELAALKAEQQKQLIEAQKRAQTEREIAKAKQQAAKRKQLEILKHALTFAIEDTQTEKPDYQQLPENIANSLQILTRLFTELKNTESKMVALNHKFDKLGEAVVKTKKIRLQQQKLLEEKRKQAEAEAKKQQQLAAQRQKAREEAAEAERQAKAEQQKIADIISARKETERKVNAKIGSHKGSIQLIKLNDNTEKPRAIFSHSELLEMLKKEVNSRCHGLDFSDLATDRKKKVLKEAIHSCTIEIQQNSMRFFSKLKTEETKDTPRTLYQRTYTPEELQESETYDIPSTLTSTRL